MKATFKFKSVDWNKHSQEILNSILEIFGPVDYSVQQELGEDVHILFSTPGELNSENSEPGKTEILLANGDVFPLADITELKVGERLIPMSWVEE